MGDGGISFATIAAVASIASAATGVYTSISSASAQADAAKQQESQLNEQAAIAKTQAAQRQTDRERSLMVTLGTQQAMRAGRGVDLYSPSGINLAQTSEDAEARDESTLNLDLLNKQSGIAFGIESAQAQAANAPLIGLAGAGQSLLSGAKGFQALKSSADNSTS